MAGALDLDDRSVVEQAVLALRPGLAWRPTSYEAADCSEALVTLPRREEPEICVAEIVEALKLSDLRPQALPG